jgi:ATP-dependent helicase/nuclease subunit A
LSLPFEEAPSGTIETPSRAADASPTASRDVSAVSDGAAPGIPARMSPADARDAAARARAVDPRFNVALDASAGTGKTRVLVDRYVNLLRAGVDPANILAMTFTRKAATEMRDRIVDTLGGAAERGEITAARWKELRERLGDIAISTIDAFCLSLLREFPLEADLDPGFAVADDSEVPRLVDESLDRALRICRSVARDDERVALVFAQLGERRARAGLAALLGRRIVAPEILSRFLARSRRDLTVADAAGAAARALLGMFAAMADGVEADAGEGLRTFVMSGPADASFMLLVLQLEQLDAVMRSESAPDPRLVFAAYARTSEYFLTRQGEPRTRLVHPRAAFASEGHWRRHRELVAGHAQTFLTAWRAYRHDINVLVSGGVWRMFRIAETEYRRTLDAHAVLDFSDLLLRTLELLRRMEEFARSRYRLESRYHHVLVDEFQDTSRAQWELIALLVESWGEGAGLAHGHPLPPSIFIVGDRKQSIYGFRDADVSVMGDAIRFLQGLRPDGDVRRSIARSFRSVPALLAFVNDVCHDIEKAVSRKDAFEYGVDDRFPVDEEARAADDASKGSEPSVRLDDVLGIVAAESPDACARAVAGEVARLIESQAVIRDIGTGVRRPVRAGDVAILFRTRDSHRAFEDALEQRGIASYVYKGLGFFESDEVRDVLALLGFLAHPGSNLRAAAFLRSGFVRLTDEGLRRLGPHLAAALTADALPDTVTLDETDAQRLRRMRVACRRWLGRVDRMSHAELLDLALSEAAYAVETGGSRIRQARENLKKVRGLVRRAQNAGYATLERIVAYLDRLAVGDESNAAIDAVDAVSLMTVHAAKGLEFPVVFVVNLSRGTGNRREPIRVVATGDDEVSVSVGDFQSSTDEDDPAQEIEETKRLLYVALTRARDRLYLGTVIKDGRLQPGRGSLADVLPGSMVNQFALTREESIVWRASGGHVHRFRVVAVPPADPDVPAARARLTNAAHHDAVDFDPLTRRAIPSAASALSTVEGLALSSAGGAAVFPLAPPASDRLLGTLVHRLVQRLGLPSETDAVDAQAVLQQLIRPEERTSVGDVDTVIARAAEFFAGLSARAEVRRLCELGELWHEVPFTSIAGGVRARGAIDCVVAFPRRPADAVTHDVVQLTVLEFKTGRPRHEHADQVTRYKQALAAVFPGVPVMGVLVYSDTVTSV